jgi:hypothetical protein
MGVTVALVIDDSEEEERSDREDDKAFFVALIVRDTLAGWAVWALSGCPGCSAASAALSAGCMLSGRGHHQRALLWDPTVWPPESNPHLKNKICFKIAFRKIFK